jgi:hypothetical protein
MIGVTYGAPTEFRAEQKIEDFLTYKAIGTTGLCSSVRKVNGSGIFSYKSLLFKVCRYRRFAVKGDLLLKNN